MATSVRSAKGQDGRVGGTGSMLLEPNSRPECRKSLTAAAMSPRTGIPSLPRTHGIACQGWPLPRPRPTRPRPPSWLHRMTQRCPRRQRMLRRLPQQHSPMTCLATRAWMTMRPRIGTATPPRTRGKPHAGMLELRFPRTSLPRAPIHLAMRRDRHLRTRAMSPAAHRTSLNSPRTFKGTKARWPRLLQRTGQTG